MPAIRPYVLGALGVILSATLPSTAPGQSFDALMRTGRAQIDSGRFDDAVKTLEKAVKADPKSAEARFQLGRAVGSLAQNANVLRQPGLARRIKSEFEKAVELDPKHLDARDGLITFYLQAPGVMGGSVSKAREQAAEIKRISPLRGYLAEANIARDQKDLAGTERALRTAATEFPDSLNAVTGYLSFLSNNGRAEEAFGPIDRFLAKYPGNRAMLYWLGRTAAVTGKELDRGDVALRTLLTTAVDTGPRILPENVHYRLGDIAAKRGDVAAARAEYNKALALNPRHESARNALRALPGGG